MLIVDWFMVQKASISGAYYFVSVQSALGLVTGAS